MRTWGCHLAREGAFRDRKEPGLPLDVSEWQALAHRDCSPIELCGAQAMEAAGCTHPESQLQLGTPKGTSALGQRPLPALMSWLRPSSMPYFLPTSTKECVCGPH